MPNNKFFLGEIGKIFSYQTGMSKNERGILPRKIHDEADWSSYGRSFKEQSLIIMMDCSKKLSPTQNKFLRSFEIDQNQRSKNIVET
jgi:hypothetical protein